MLASQISPSTCSVIPSPCAVQFTGQQNAFHLPHEQRKYLVQMACVSVAERTGEFSPVSQKMQAAALLHQTRPEAWRHVAL